MGRPHILKKKKKKIYISLIKKKSKIKTMKNEQLNSSTPNISGVKMTYFIICMISFIQGILFFSK